MILKTKTITYDHRVRYFWLLVGIAVLSIFTYIYGISATAKNIAMRESLEDQIIEVTANLNALEFQYIALKNNITLDLAYSYGFREAKSPLYISRTGSTLSFNTEN